MRHKVHRVNYFIPTNLVRFPFGRSTYYVLKRLRDTVPFPLLLEKFFSCCRNGVGPRCGRRLNEELSSGLGPRDVCFG